MMQNTIDSVLSDGAPVHIAFCPAEELLEELPDNVLDSICSDPPAGINFMQRSWDSDLGGRDFWIEWMTGVMRECLRACKPGAHSAIWALPRTSHWTATAMENAGWEIRDVITHHNGQGMAKGANISKEIDRLAGAERPVLGDNPNHRAVSGVNYEGVYAGGNTGNAKITGPATDDAKKWDGWGTLLKPSSEHWIIGRKPISEKTIAANVLKWGTGALNIDACRVKTDEKLTRKLGKSTESASGWKSQKRSAVAGKDGGRWPPNVVLSHGPGCVLSGLRWEKNTSGSLTGDEPSAPTETVYGEMQRRVWAKHGDEDGYELLEDWECDDDCPAAAIDAQSESGAGRFFPTFGFHYFSKPKVEKHFGCENLYWRKIKDGFERISKEEYEALPKSKRAQGNVHATVKSIALMKWLCRLITPPGGVVADPFCGSGTTGVACLGEFQFVGIEKDKAHHSIALARVAAWQELMTGSSDLWEDDDVRVTKEKPPKSTQLKLLDV